jgi:hypothetical protein
MTAGGVTPRHSITHHSMNRLRPQENGRIGLDGREIVFVRYCGKDAIQPSST